MKNNKDLRVALAALSAGEAAFKERVRALALDLC